MYIQTDITLHNIVIYLTLMYYIVFRIMIQYYHFETLHTIIYRIFIYTLFVMYMYDNI